MTNTANDEGKKAAHEGLSAEGCPYADGTPEHRDWLGGWNSGANPATETDTADAPFEQVRGLSSDELADVIGADDYEAGADQIPPPGQAPA